MSASRQKAEKGTAVDLSTTVDTLLSLVGYQLLDEIRLFAKAIGSDPGVIEVRADTKGDRLRIRVGDGGTGLGLVMVNRLARDLGGKIHIENRSEGGACVTIDLPRGKQNG